MKIKKLATESNKYLVLVSYVLLIVLVNCSNQIRVPNDEIESIYNNNISSDNINMTNEMNLVHTPEKSFWIDPFEQSELDKEDFFSVPNQLPHVGISVKQAANVCYQQGKRLCTNYEWSNACLGTHRLRYSYSNHTKKEICNTSNTDIVNTGSYNKCNTDTGLYDMIGNAMEWTADARSGMAIAMGGSYRTGGRADCFTKFYFPPGIKSTQIGFRCCQNQNNNLVLQK